MLIINNEVSQVIVNSYIELAKIFETTVGKIKEAEKKGKPLIDNVTGKNIL